MSRGLRNCNPGNIRLSGTRYRGEVFPSRDPLFRTFESIEWGYRAIFVLLHTYAVRYGCRTLRAMICRYAPPSENRTADYLRFVAAQTSIDEDACVDTLDRKTMTAIVSAISRFENGLSADPAAVAAGWGLYIADFGG